MTTNQMDILAGIILHWWYGDMDLSYREAIEYYTVIREEISYWNEGKTNDERGMEDERAE